MWGFHSTVKLQRLQIGLPPAFGIMQSTKIPIEGQVLLQECHCMLFLTEDNGFRGEDRAISIETIEEATKGMSGVQP